MKNNLEKQIYLRCPIIFRNRDAGMQSNLMYFGFDCGDGWFQLIYDLSAAIETIAQNMKDTGISEERLPSVFQVKEKFGGQLE